MEVILQTNINKNLFIIGLMSGTSMDGINACLVKTNGIHLDTKDIYGVFPYKNKTKSKLQKLVRNYSFLKHNKELIQEVSNLVTIDHINAVNSILKYTTKLPDLVGFHGQTIFHDGNNNYSVQIGSPQLMAKKLRINVISNFRENDLKNKGQGAPLAPIYHKSIIKKLKIDEPACFINIGGVANLSYCYKNILIGFDIGPGNGLMDMFVQKFLYKNYDTNGELAAKGKINQKLLSIFLSNDYFYKHYPKTLDRSFFNNYIEKIIECKLNNEDALATLSELTVQSIRRSLEFLPRRPKNIVIMGGGMFNKHLIKKLKSDQSYKILTADEIGIRGDMIEAELIAYLSARSIYNLPLTFPSTTGVLKACSGGILYKKPFWSFM